MRVMMTNFGWCIGVVLIALSSGCVEDDCINVDAPVPGAGVDFSALQCQTEWSVCEPRDFCLSLGGNGLSDVEMAVLNNAVEDWEVSTREAIRFADLEDAPDCKKIVVEVVNNDHPLMQELKATHGFFPRGYAAGGVIYLNSDRMCGTRIWHSVSRHEFGHCFGLKHVSDPTSLMYDTYSADHMPFWIETSNVQAFMNTANCCLSGILDRRQRTQK
jgi:hypothetical protein